MLQINNKQTFFFKKNDYVGNVQTAKADPLRFAYVAHNNKFISPFYAPMYNSETAPNIRTYGITYPHITNLTSVAQTQYGITGAFNNTTYYAVYPMVQPYTYNWFHTCSATTVEFDSNLFNWPVQPPYKYFNFNNFSLRRHKQTSNCIFWFNL